MNIPSPQQFNQLLSQSLIPEWAKKLILEKLPTLSNKQVLAIYQILEQEQEKINQAKSEYETKLNLASIKFEQEFNQLTNN